MTPDNLSFFWALVTVPLLLALLEVVQRVVAHRRRANRTEAALSHDQYDEGIARWDSLSTMQQLREQHAQDQLNYGTPLFERPLDLEAPSTTNTTS